MPIFLHIGLALSLLGVPLLLLAFKIFCVDSLSLLSRVALWLLAIAVLVLAAYSSGSWRQQIGVQTPTAFHLGVAFLAALAMLSIWPVAQRLQKALGGVSVEQTARFRMVAGFSVGYRVFIAITAAVVEEILYRGYAVGIGQYIFGSVSVAVVVSLGVFVIAHFRWGMSHLFSVFWTGLILSLLFVYTNDLLACILAHGVIDAVGLLLAPAVMARKLTREPSS